MTFKVPTTLYAAVILWTSACGGSTRTNSASLDGSIDASINNSLKGTCEDYALNNEETEVDCGGPNCMPCTANSKSCKALLSKNPGTPSSVYSLDADGSGPLAAYLAYCDMDADGGGWTLALKADGASATFSYEKSIWTNNQLLNIAASGLDTNEAKLESFNRIPARALRIGMSVAGQTRWLTVPLNISPSQTLYDIFSHNYRVHTTIGRNAWMTLIDGSVLQNNCNEEGLNLAPRVANNATGPRIGIVGNDNDECLTPDSYLGIGSIAHGAGCGMGFTATSGNGAACTGAPFTNTTAFGYVMVRE